MLKVRKPSRNTVFPIHNSTDRRSQERFMRAVWDIPCEAIEVIKSLQPYLRGKAYKDDPLWQLNKLCNLDKHVTMAINSTALDIETSGPPDIPLFHNEIDDGVELIIPLAFKDQVQFKPRLPELIFGEPRDGRHGPFEIRERDIAAIHEFIRNTVIPSFARFFPSTPDTPRPQSPPKEPAPQEKR